MTVIARYLPTYRHIPKGSVGKNVDDFVKRCQLPTNLHRCLLPPCNRVLFGENHCLQFRVIFIISNLVLTIYGIKVVIEYF